VTCPCCQQPELHQYLFKCQQCRARWIARLPQKARDEQLQISPELRDAARDCYRTDVRRLRGIDTDQPNVDTVRSAQRRSTRRVSLRRDASSLVAGLWIVEREIMKSQKAMCYVVCDNPGACVITCPPEPVPVNSVIALFVLVVCLGATAWFVGERK